MKLTRSVSYAVGILLQIQRIAPRGPVIAAKIARGCQFPPRFLYRILRRLVDAELLEGTSGPGGGYALARPPKQITLLDIVEAVDSTPSANALVPVSSHQRGAIDKINALCEQNAERFAEELRQVSLADLSRKGRGKPKAAKQKPASRARRAKAK